MSAQSADSPNCTANQEEEEEEEEMILQESEVYGNKQYHLGQFYVNRHTESPCTLYQ